MIKYIKRLFNRKNDYAKEINNILNDNMNCELYIEIFNKKKYIKINVKNVNYNVDYVISKKKFLTTLNNLIINNECTLTLSFVDIYYGNQLRTIIKALKFENKIKHLYLINPSNCPYMTYVTVFELEQLFKYNNTLTHFTCINGQNYSELLAIFRSLQFNKTLQSFTFLNPKLPIIDKKIFNNFIIHNYTLNTIFVNKLKFSNYKSEIKLDFHYNNVNFIYI